MFHLRDVLLEQYYVLVCRMCMMQLSVCAHAQTNPVYPLQEEAATVLTSVKKKIKNVGIFLKVMWCDNLWIFLYSGFSLLSSHVSGFGCWMYRLPFLRERFVLTPIVFIRMTMRRMMRKMQIMLRSFWEGEHKELPCWLIEPEYVCVCVHVRTCE